MSNLPARLPEGVRSSRQVARAARAQQNTELAIYEYNLDARRRAECDRIDSQAIADVTRTALEEELSVLDWGLERAGSSQAKKELVARMVALQSEIDVRRIARRFGE